MRLTIPRPKPIIISYQARPSINFPAYLPDEPFLSFGMESSTLKNYYNILGQCAAMKKLYDNIEKVAHSPNATVLILGESGTGKELVARAIHNASANASEPFVEINCTTLPDNLLETELFGYEKGAYTDAKQMKRGLLELADGGSFFLDEIGDLNIQLQAKLLKVLDEQVFRRVGGVENIRVTIRIVAATNRDLFDLVQKQLFREDLYYRLDVITIKVPPLRERDIDIIMLAEHFRVLANKEHGRNVRGFSEQSKEMLLRYPWPGNVRELKNRVERAVLLNETSVVDPDDLNLGAGHIVKNYPVRVNAVDKLEINIPSHGISFEELEKAVIRQVMDIAKGNVSKAARLLKLSRETMRYRIKKYGMNGIDDD
ncbi:sigma-54-dependent Fis family transcriptional regulator [candidate division KSB1 bacterium]|nr:sigma-54-dependent Fis family transcriptional regulator [candidate division KSB1 bacterium]